MVLLALFGTNTNHTTYTYLDVRIDDMNRTIKKLLIETASIIGPGIPGYAGFEWYVAYRIQRGCGMDDTLLRPYKLT